MSGDKYTGFRVKTWTSSEGHCCASHDIARSSGVMMAHLVPYRHLTVTSMPRDTERPYGIEPHIPDLATATKSYS